MKPLTPNGQKWLKSLPEISKTQGFALPGQRRISPNLRLARPKDFS